MNAKKTDDSPSPLVARVEELEAQLQEAQTQADDAKAGQMRALADLENFRRRQTQDQIRWGSQAVISFLQTALPSFLELSLGASHSQDEAVKQVVEKFFAELKKQGLDSLNPQAGEVIDPLKHDVLMAEEGDPGTVVRCLEIGWQFNDQVILPAKVSGAQS